MLPIGLLHRRFELVLSVEEARVIANAAMPLRDGCSSNTSRSWIDLQSYLSILMSENMWPLDSDTMVIIGVNNCYS